MFGKKREKVKTIIGKHISGLDVGNADLFVKLSATGLLISSVSLKKEWNLSLDRIQRITFYNETEIEKVMKSSMIKGMIGAAAFGMPGALIGSRPKEKEKRKVHFFLIVEYPENKIVIASDDGFGVGGIVDYFKQLKPDQIMLNLTL